MIKSGKQKAKSGKLRVTNVNDLRIEDTSSSGGLTANRAQYTFDVSGRQKAEGRKLRRANFDVTEL